MKDFKDELWDAPPEVKLEIEQMKLIYGTAHVRRTWDDKGIVKYEVIAPEDIYKESDDEKA